MKKHRWLSLVLAVALVLALTGMALAATFPSSPISTTGSIQINDISSYVLTPSTLNFGTGNTYSTGNGDTIVLVDWVQVTNNTGETITGFNFVPSYGVLTDFTLERVSGIFDAEDSITSIGSIENGSTGWLKFELSFVPSDFTAATYVLDGELAGTLTPQ